MKYISAPFSKAPNIEERVRKITEYAANEMLKKQNVICPTTLGFAFSSVNPDLRGKDSMWWMTWWYQILQKCDEMDVLMFDGWKKSFGVKREIIFAKKWKIKINYIKIENE